MADEGKRRIALLIDADNAPASKIDVVLAELARHGEVNVRRAYGNWKSQHLNGWEKALHAYAIVRSSVRLQQRKNASDMAMVVDARTYCTRATSTVLRGLQRADSPWLCACAATACGVGFGEEIPPEPSSRPHHPCTGNSGHRKVTGAPPGPRLGQGTPQDDADLMRPLLNAWMPLSATWLGSAHRGGSRFAPGSFDSRNYGYRRSAICRGHACSQFNKE